jgi:hypothetical protein
MRGVLTGLFLLAAGPALADVEGSTYSFGLWAGGAATTASGAFSHCYATLSYTGGEQVWVNVMGPDVLQLVFSFPGVTFTEGQEMDASLMMESGLPTPGKAVAMDDKHIVFSMSPMDGAHSFLSQGRWLRILGVGSDAALEAPGLGGVIGMVRQCHAAQTG